MKRILFAGFVLAAFCALTLTGCGSDSSDRISGGDSKSDTQRDDSVIYVAVSPNNEPFEYIDDDGEFNGFDIALAMKIGEELGRTPVFVERYGDDIYSSLSCGIAEMALSSLEVSDSARQKAEFSDDYITLSSAIVKSVYDVRISNIHSLASVKSVAVVQDSFSDKYLTNELGLTNASRFKNAEDAARSFAAGEQSALFIDGNIADRIAERTAEFEIAEKNIGQKKYSVAVEKGNSALIKKINEIIGRFRRDGTLLDLRSAYLGSDANLKELFTSEIKNLSKE